MQPLPGTCPLPQKPTSPYTVGRMLPLTAQHRQLATDKVRAFRNDKPLSCGIGSLPNRYSANDSRSGCAFAFTARDPALGSDLFCSAESRRPSARLSTRVIFTGRSLNLTRAIFARARAVGAQVDCDA